MRPIFIDSALQSPDCLAKGLEVGVLDLNDILGACSQFHYSSTHDPQCIFALIKVREILILRKGAQSTVTFVFNDDPLVVVGSEVCCLMDCRLFLLLFYIRIFPPIGNDELA